MFQLRLTAQNISLEGFLIVPRNITFVCLVSCSIQGVSKMVRKIVKSKFIVRIWSLDPQYTLAVAP